MWAPQKVGESVQPKTNTEAAQARQAIKKQLVKEQRALMVRKFLTNKLAMLGAIMTLAVILFALLAPVLAPQGPLEMSVFDRLTAPSMDGYIFGTDNLGRSVFARVIYGARVSLVIGASVGLLSMILGSILGLYASYYRALDNVIMRICDGLSAIPSTLLAIALMAMLEPSVTNLVISLTVVNVPRVARIARSSAVVVREQTYIEAMRALGASSTRIIWGHIAPNIISPVVVQSSYIFANAIITEAALSFLGVGVPLPSPSWGNILYEGKAVIQKAWWMIVYPGVFTAVTVLGLNIFGDGLRDLLDPQTK